MAKRIRIWKGRFFWHWREDVSWWGASGGFALSRDQAIRSARSHFAHQAQLKDRLAAFVQRNRENSEVVDLDQEEGNG